MKISPTFDGTAVVPTRFGRDLENEDGTKDAHVRIDSYKEVGTNVYVDVLTRPSEIQT
jgi:hypothetical protein